MYFKLRSTIRHFAKEVERIGDDTLRYFCMEILDELSTATKHRGENVTFSSFNNVRIPRKFQASQTRPIYTTSDRGKAWHAAGMRNCR